MKELLQKAKFDDIALKRYINTLTVNELNNLTEPCYYPDWKKHFHELLHSSGLEEKDIKEFGKRFFQESVAKKSLEKYGKTILIQQDSGINLLFVLMYYFLHKRDQQTFSTLMILHLIHQYGNRIRVYINFCQPDVFAYTLDNLNPTHLFAREKTISNAIFHLAQEMKKRYSAAILELDPDKITKFFYESRSRISQSLRSFAELYHANAQKGRGITTEKDIDDTEGTYPQELEKGNRVAELVAQKICVFKEVDYKAIEQAKSLTRINTSFTTIITNALQKPELSENIKFIIELFFKDMKSVNDICGKNSISYVKKLMSLKRTTKSVYFKQEINTLLLKIIKDTRLASKYNTLTPQTQFQINSFLSFYLAFYTKNLVC